MASLQGRRGKRRRRSSSGGGIEKPFPWRDWMKGAFGALHWTPAVFWASTLTEYMFAIEGFNEANGGGSKKEEGPTDDDMADLLARYG
ncbi:phage tail assembly chaperone [Mesorhizobium sp. B2-5-7]|uniref:phage tail assembly chaperone n=1 Tax=Mesorhizobium sp. B2-5-7 TaxID=2589923 RepID=UPI0024848501|nr:phage tail assembly chaperone [Mesorhizobium sp. B2-5-7]